MNASIFLIEFPIRPASLNAGTTMEITGGPLSVVTTESLRLHDSDVCIRTRYCIIGSLKWHERQATPRVPASTGGSNAGLDDAPGRPIHEGIPRYSRKGILS